MTRVRSIDPSDPAQRDEVLRVLDAIGPALIGSAAEDRPFEPPPTMRFLRAEVLHPIAADPVQVLVAEDGAEVVGYAVLDLPVHDNQHLALLSPYVAVAHRRRGVARALLAEAVEVSRSMNRRALLMEATEGTAMEGFAKSTGATNALVEVRRHQPVLELDLERIRAVRREAERAAAGYTLEWWVGPVSPQRQHDVAVITHTLNDAPLGTLDIEDEKWDADRVAQRDAALLEAGLRLHTGLALAADGEPAGYTEVSVAEDGRYGWQWGTGVARAHRGHRLGLLLKAGMVERLRVEEPHLEVIATTNAPENVHMIAVNEALGYEVVGQIAEWQLELTEDTA